jgi:hypothetical protein
MRMGWCEGIEVLGCEEGEKCLGCVYATYDLTKKTMSLKMIFGG